MKTKTFALGLLFVVGTGIAAFAQEQEGNDPPPRVLRLNYTSGTVSMQPAGVDEWAPAVINRPFSIGDYLYTDAKSVAELHTDVGAIRMGEYTNFGVLNLSDNLVQLKLTEGDMQFRIRELNPNEAIEVDTPNAAVNLLRSGEYHIHVDDQGNTTYVAVRSGQAEITGGGQAFTLNPGDGANLSGTDQLAYDVEQVPRPDAFDVWCEQRDAREDQARSAQYVPQSVIGYEDLDDAGDWTTAPEYGAVWYPRSVPADWAPYHYGHWAWIEPWGWTWVDDARWGFAPFHYGRWVYWRDRWGWAPGPMAVGRPGFRGPIVRPVYAPALVAWFGGSHFGVSVSVGPSLGWAPLGWGEVYTPSYRCGPSYFNRVNVTNTRIVNVTNINTIYRNVYINRGTYTQNYVNMRAPRGFAAVPENAFASGRPVHQAALTVDPRRFGAERPTSVLAPSIAPTRTAIVSTLGRPAAGPSARVQDRPVFARSAPGAAPVPFAARQQYLQQHAGQPHDFAAMRQAVGTEAARPAGPVRQLGETPRPFAATPGQRSTTPGAYRPDINAPQPQRQPNASGNERPFGHGVPPNSRGNQPAQSAEPREARPAPESRPSYNAQRAPAAAASPDGRNYNPEVRNTPEVRNGHGVPPNRTEQGRQYGANPNSRPEYQARPQPQEARPNYSAPQRNNAPAAPEYRQPAPAQRETPRTFEHPSAPREVPQRSERPAERPAPAPQRQEHQDRQDNHAHSESHDGQSHSEHFRGR